jgi:UDP-N-acetylmuramoyl-tripeptide--D-alanyl-D-alanine ligase
MAIRFDEQFIRRVIPECTITGNEYLNIARFSVDTRTLQAGDIFVALPGAHINGDAFIQEALKKGASGIVAAKGSQNILQKIDASLLEKKCIIMVPDTLDALVKLAMAWRAEFNYPVVAITGSVGKTSTKEMLGQILNLNGTRYIASEGNQNTKIGISLNILRMRPEHEAAIFEVGINKRNEMAELSKILKPSYAIITGIGHCHMEGLGSLADIALEKRDVFKCFTEQNIGIINGDVSSLSQVSYAHPVIKFGSKTTNQIQARKITINNSTVTFTLKIYKEKHIVTLSKPHVGVVFNALAATAAAHLLNVPHAVILKSIQQPLHVPGRFEHKKLKAAKGTIINDCYNANPESMKAALLAFQNIQTSAQKIAVLGDMLELGVNSPFWHRQLGRFLRKVPSLKQVILVGDLIKWTKKTAPIGLSIEMVPTWAQAVEKLSSKIDEESVILVKGSNGVGLRHLVDAFTEKQ